MSDRVVIDPEGLRRLALRMRGASTSLSSAARELTRRPLPSMPAAVAAAVGDTLRRVDIELHDLAAGLVRDAGVLLASANRAEMGGFERLGRTGSGLQRFQPAGLTLDPDPALAGGDQAQHAEAWSLELVSDAHDGMDPDPSPDPVDIDSILERNIASTGDLPSDPLSEFTLTSASGYDALPLEDPAVMAGPGSPPGGALGVALQDAGDDAAATGIVGCLLVGTDLGAVMPDRDPS